MGKLERQAQMKLREFASVLIKLGMNLRSFTHADLDDATLSALVEGLAGVREVLDQITVLLPN